MMWRANLIDYLRDLIRDRLFIKINKGFIIRVLIIKGMEPKKLADAYNHKPFFRG